MSCSRSPGQHPSLSDLPAVIDSPFREGCAHSVLRRTRGGTSAAPLRLLQQRGSSAARDRLSGEAAIFRCGASDAAIVFRTQVASLERRRGSAPSSRLSCARFRRQRHSEPGPAARAEAVVAPPGTNRPGCARSRQGTEFAESRFRASRVTFVRRQRPYRRSSRSRSSGCCSARAKRSSHRCRDKRCSVSSLCLADFRCQ